ncbi:hypothetical protein CRU99_06840 [Malaciobacter mytili]|uniref:hypothetical protein n=1 Tax=Malaciobacter mytili TaxID=603050 RepID=UPI00100A48AE|nr:hypothetical protein [Malaciobacter mytili]RXI43642.1 hypothetical protein CRU99_06840 [Malaciobacter mytili]
MKKLIYSLLFFAVILNAGMNNNNEIQMQQIKNMSAEEFSRLLASETSKSLPITLDAVTTVIKSIALGKSVQYYKTLNLEHPRLKEIWDTKKEEFKVAMFEQDSKMVCYTEILSYMIMNKDVILRYYYTDTNHRPLFNYSVEKEDCLKFK